ncbi:hypothetical protein BT63DRAFT_275506 [Microthyrium microscopicum]|uniref:Uncharacterized protein n=1 Tax=Microthyrium microscopicum TaxID=703497 RepID=A0A6A6UAR5_9PEZI|nr:hypothetical protein BT63DRAFT_275506 [Microthyrium microscopicum]
MRYASALYAVTVLAIGTTAAYPTDGQVADSILSYEPPRRPLYSSSPQPYKPKRPLKSGKKAKRPGKGKGGRPSKGTHHGPTLVTSYPSEQDDHTGPESYDNDPRPGGVPATPNQAPWYPYPNQAQQDTDHATYKNPALNGDITIIVSPTKGIEMIGPRPDYYPSPNQVASAEMKTETKTITVSSMPTPVSGWVQLDYNEVRPYQGGGGGWSQPQQNPYNHPSEHKGHGSIPNGGGWPQPQQNPYNHPSEPKGHGSIPNGGGWSQPQQHPYNHPPEPKGHGSIPNGGGWSPPQQNPYNHPPEPKGHGSIPNGGYYPTVSPSGDYPPYHQQPGEYWAPKPPQDYRDSTKEYDEAGTMGSAGHGTGAEKGHHAQPPSRQPVYPHPYPTPTANLHEQQNASPHYMPPGLPPQPNWVGPPYPPEAPVRPPPGYPSQGEDMVEHQGRPKPELHPWPAHVPGSPYENVPEHQNMPGPKARPTRTDLNANAMSNGWPAVTGQVTNNHGEQYNPQPNHHPQPTPTNPAPNYPEYPIYHPVPAPRPAPPNAAPGGDNGDYYNRPDSNVRPGTSPVLAPRPAPTPNSNQQQQQQPQQQNPPPTQYHPPPRDNVPTPGRQPYKDNIAPPTRPPPDLTDDSKWRMLQDYIQTNQQNHESQPRTVAPSPPQVETNPYYSDEALEYYHYPE